MYKSNTHVCTMYVQMYYTSVMTKGKTSKTFRLSQAAIDVLESKENATQFIEELILNVTSAPGAPTSGNVEAMLIRILEILENNTGTPEAIKAVEPMITTAEKIISPPTAVRDLSTIKLDIQHLEDELAQRLEESQDPQYSRELNMDYTKRIDMLWKEYHATRQTN